MRNGKTLIRIEKPRVQGDLFENETVKAWETELKKVRHHLFGAKTPRTKRKYRQQDKEIRERIAGELKKNGWSNRSAQQLAEWDPYDQNASCPFFDPEWMFDLPGFDVVLGNPPYVQIQKFPKKQKDLWVKQGYQTYAAMADIYCLFYERGAELLNERGYLYYITSNRWMRSGYGEKLRFFLSKVVDTEVVLDFGMALNFSAATTLTNILGFEKTAPEQAVRGCYALDAFAAMENPKAYFESNAVEMESLDESGWVILPKERYAIKKAVEEQGVPLEKWDLHINYGIKTGFNDAFYLTQEQRDELIAREPQAKEIIVPLLRGRYVGRYETNWDGTWMLGTFPTLGIDLKKYPEVRKHLEGFHKRLEPKPKGHTGKWGGRKAGSYEWFETQDSIGYYKEFLKPKIMYPNMTKYLPFYYDEGDGVFTNDKGFIINSDTESLPALMAILNSSLFKCCFRDNFPELLGQTYEVRKVFVDKIPIKKPSNSEKMLFEILVPMVQQAKKQDLRIEAAFLEDLIDACVLESYFPEEASAKNLCFIDQTLSLLSVKSHDIQSFIQTINAPSHPIRNQLLRLTADSPELFGVIKEEGRV
jgi:adenine-specific DNA-methyltransferase